MNRPWLLALLATLPAACVPPGGTSATGAVPDGVVSYRCDAGAGLVVRYDAAADPPTAEFERDGANLLLLEPSTRPGLRYSWPSDGSYFIWELDGGSGHLSYRDGERGRVDPVLSGCRA